MGATKKYFVLLFLSAFGFILSQGCQKEAIAVLIDGKVVNGNSGMGIEGARVLITSKNYGNASYGGDERVLMDTYSGANGAFSAEFERGKPIIYEVTLDKPGFVRSEFEVQVDEWTTSAVNELIFEMFSIAYVRVQLVNGPPTANDQVDFFLDPGANGTPGCCPKVHLASDAAIPLVDTVIATTGSQWVHWDYYITSGGEGSAFSGKGYVADQDTLLIRVEY